MWEKSYTPQDQYNLTCPECLTLNQLHEQLVNSFLWMRQTQQKEEEEKKPAKEIQFECKKHSKMALKYINIKTGQSACGQCLASHRILERKLPSHIIAVEEEEVRELADEAKAQLEHWSTKIIEQLDEAVLSKKVSLPFLLKNIQRVVEFLPTDQYIGARSKRLI